MYLYEKIKATRLQRNFTQEYVAEKIGVSVTAYGQIERGKTPAISLKRLELIADTLGIGVTEIIENKQPEQ